MARAKKFRSKNGNRSSTLTNMETNQIILDEAEACMINIMDPVNHRKTVTGEDLTEICAGALQEEHKQLLVRAVTERMLLQMPEDEIWNEIKIKTGYDHRALWKDMKNVTMKKLMCLLPADDFIKKIPTKMQLNATDWLLFDLILVHEDINVVNIGSTKINKGMRPELQCLQELFELVKEYNIENLSGEALIDAWGRITLKYNGRGRQCSPMLLQLRWYQLKELARSVVYDSIAELDRNTRRILISIVTTYQKIVTQKFRKWRNLLADKCIVLPEEFVQMINDKECWNMVEAREGWYLHIKEELVSQIDDSVNNTDIIFIDVDNVDGVQEKNMGAEHKDKETITTVDNSKSMVDAKDTEEIDLDSDDEINEIIREKADNLKNLSDKLLNYNTKHDISTLDKAKNMSVQPDINPIISNVISLACDSDNEMSTILKEKANLMSLEVPKHTENPKHAVHADKGTKQRKNHEDLDEVGFDDGEIVLEDDGIELEQENGCQSQNSESNKASSTYSEVDEPEVDVKLLMNTIVCTKKIDYMEIFKFIDYESVNDKRVIDYVEAESKRGNNYTSKDKEIVIDRKSVPDEVREKEQMASAGHIRDLIEIISSDDEDDVRIVNVTSNLPVKRSKVINLPDKNQIRLTNQSLQIAEVTPTHQDRLNSNTVNDSINKEGCTMMSTPEKNPPKRFKADLGMTSTYTNDYCCWAREIIVRNQLGLVGNLSTHICDQTSCSCCCRTDLVTFLSSKISSNVFAPKIPEAAFFKVKEMYNTQVNNTIVTLSKSDGDRKAIHLDNVLNEEAQNIINHNNDHNTPLLKCMNGKNTIQQVKKIGTINCEKQQSSSNDIKNHQIPMLNNDEICINTKKKPKTVKSLTKQQRTPGNSAPIRNIKATNKNIICAKLDIKESSKNVISTEPNIHTTASKELLTVVENGLDKRVIPQINEKQCSDSLQTQKKEPLIYLSMPDGVNFVQIPQEGIAIAINSGVTVSQEQMNSLMSICAAANTQYGVSGVHHDG